MNDRCVTSWQRASATTVDEVVRAMLFLMTNRYMTGSTQDVDGGFVLKPRARQAPACVDSRRGTSMADQNPHMDHRKYSWPLHAWS